MDVDSFIILRHDHILERSNSVTIWTSIKFNEMDMIKAKLFHFDLWTNHSSFKDMGYFLTGALVVSGFALPAVLAHAEIVSSLPISTLL